ncbi:MAG TPA: integrase core domain-containing protein [Candidatus Paceibacterota bacterium]|nr:integrase core domain-containing protein [Candidatus Paceibacterota bacterium]
MTNMTHNNEILIATEKERWLKLHLNAVRFLEALISSAPFKISGVKTDNGSIFTNRYVGAYKAIGQRKRHHFDQACLSHGIVHYLIQPGKPAQNGKVERSHRTDREEFWDRTPFSSLEQLEQKQKKYIDWYNNEREHLGINGLTPREKIKECQI